MAKFKCDNGHTYLVPDKSCVLCDFCDVLWDYTNGPHTVICLDKKDTNLGIEGKCPYFVETDNNC